MVTSDPSGSRSALGLLLVFLLALAPGCATPDPTPPTRPEPQAGTPQPPPPPPPGQAVVRRVTRPAAPATQATVSPRAPQRGTPPASTQTSDPGSRYLSSGVTGALTIETLPPRPPASADLDAAE